MEGKSCDRRLGDARRSIERSGPRARRRGVETHRRVGIFGLRCLCGRLRGRKRETDEPLTNIRSKAAAKASLLDTTRDGRFEIDRTPGVWAIGVARLLTSNGRLDTRRAGVNATNCQSRVNFGDWCPTEHAGWRRRNSLDNWYLSPRRHAPSPFYLAQQSFVG